MALGRPAFDHGSVVPLYEQAADYVAAAITSGELEHGQKLPAERDLADAWGIGYMTVRRAMQELRDRGLVVSRVGKGTFVAAETQLRSVMLLTVTILPGMSHLSQPPRKGERPPPQVAGCLRPLHFAAAR